MRISIQPRIRHLERAFLGKSMCVFAICQVPIALRRCFYFKGASGWFVGRWVCSGFEHCMG